MKRYQGILILGPTGSGKTPLGDYLAQTGLGQTPCYHFDFGENLRQIVQGGHPHISQAERSFLADVLHRGALLENDRYYLAETILTDFARRQGLDPGPGQWLILNGLPRHVDQARDTAALVAIRRVIHLVCTPDTVCRRIHGNTGGDRTGRRDDDLARIQHKLEIFNQRTRPLLDYYQAAGVPVQNVRVAPGTGPAEIGKNI